MGVVIGETASVGDDTMIFHGVTLGGRGGRGDRHPQIGSNVLLGAGCTILGPITVGNGSRIGASALVVDNVPENGIVRSPKAKELETG
jgi:serine O-acetyltransferase